METVETKTKTITETYHTFYCDDCGAVLGISCEESDGHYTKHGEFNMTLCVYQGAVFNLNKCLCGECQEKVTTKIYETLTILGFKKC